MKETKRIELLWQLFMDTGDPLCWMLLRRDGELGREGHSTPFRK